MTESTTATVRGTVLQKEKAACTKDLRWERKDKLQELGGGQCGWRVISEARLVWDNLEMGPERITQNWGAMERSLNSLLRARKPTERFTQRRRRSFQICQTQFSNSVFSPVWATFLRRLFRTMTPKLCKDLRCTAHEGRTGQRGAATQMFSLDTSRGPRVSPHHSQSHPS